MNDIITPSGFDLTKNLHGHVRVETRSRWTGRVVDSQEKDNLVTNAVQQMIRTQPWIASAMYGLWTPIYANALGGIMLFGDTLTESASNIDFPTSAKLVGLAGQGSNTSDAFYGSYNASESGFTSDGFRSVWDFLTSQANGTVAAVARMPKEFTSTLNRVDSRFSLSTNVNDGLIPMYYLLIGYDETNKYVYLAPYSTGTVNEVSITRSMIFRFKQDFEAISMRNAIPPASKLTLVKTLTSADGSTYATDYVYDKYDNCFLCVSGTTLHIVSASDGTHTTKSLTGTSGSTFIVTKTYYWRITTTTVYRITKANTADVAAISVAVGGSYGAGAPLGDDVISVGGSMVNFHTIVYPDGTALTVKSGNNNSDYGSLFDVGPFYSNKNASQSYAPYLYPKAGRLGTIANLDSPVTKTSSQTMKITYTLTEA